MSHRWGWRERMTWRTSRWWRRPRRPGCRCRARCSSLPPTASKQQTQHSLPGAWFRQVIWEWTERIGVYSTLRGSAIAMFLSNNLQWVSIYNIAPTEELFMWSLGQRMCQCNFKTCIYLHEHCPHSKANNDCQWDKRHHLKEKSKSEFFSKSEFSHWIEWQVCPSQPRRWWF